MFRQLVQGNVGSIDEDVLWVGECLSTSGSSERLRSQTATGGRIGDPVFDRLTPASLVAILPAGSLKLLRFSKKTWAVSISAGS